MPHRENRFNREDNARATALPSRFAARRDMEGRLASLAPSTMARFGRTVRRPTASFEVRNREFSGDGFRGRRDRQGSPGFIDRDGDGLNDLDRTDIDDMEDSDEDVSRAERRRRKKQREIDRRRRERGVDVTDSGGLAGLTEGGIDVSNSGGLQGVSALPRRRPANVGGGLGLF